MARPFVTILPIFIFVMSLVVAPAQSEKLPGEANNLQESHNDWQLNCADLENQVRCAISQTQVNQNRQRVLSLELTSVDGGNTLKGSLVLPFGLALGQGVIYNIDDGDFSNQQSIRTCLPFGCLVDLNFNQEKIAAFKAGSKLYILAKSDSGQPLSLTISLNGFTGAFKRLNELQSR